MFDVGFSEILVISVLALIVLGPEKLPRVASQVGRWIGRARGMARQFREQLEEEVNLEETRKLQTPAAPPESPPPVAQPLEPPPPLAQTPSTPPLPEPAKTYPDTYSHAHPTDAEGRPTDVGASPLESSAADPRQQDWVGGVTAPDTSTLSAADTAHAASNERGT